MKKRPINFNWPATLSFSADNGNENERFSRGKLRVFYKGETADHRYFSDDFSEELVKSLPYTPIVSHYDEEKDDFVGHATEQDIYGIVDPRGEVSFETDDKGITWAVCDTVYYTERPDKVGEIAKKIEGHSQSLELDPKTVKYTVNYDEKKHFKNIEFTAGHFVGVSVLGKDQKPAFTGSAFFSADEVFEAKMKLLKEYCEQKNEETQSGEDTMNFTEFMKLSWGDISEKVAEALGNEYNEEYYWYIVDFFDDSVIVKMYSYLDGKVSLNRVGYSVDDNGIVTLGKVNEVHVVYEDVPDVTPVSNATLSEGNEGKTVEENIVHNNELETPTVEQATVEETPSTDVDLIGEDPTTTVESLNGCTTTGDTEVSSGEIVQPVEQTVTDAELVSSDEETTVTDVPTDVNDAAQSSEGTAETAAQDTFVNTATSEKVSADEQKQEENSSSAALTDSERAEFEALKREKKEKLVDSYKDYLSEEEYKDFSVKIDSLQFEELETELLKVYKAKQEANEETEVNERAFTLYSLLNRPVKESSLATLIKENLDK